MRLDADFGVTAAKAESLRARVRGLGLDPARIEESFSRGGGKGGQKINKSANRVQLYYPPLELRVACQRERRQSLNRFLALRELVERAEMILSPKTSPRLAEFDKTRRRKARAASRAAEKYGEAPR